MHTVYRECSDLICVSRSDLCVPWCCHFTECLHWFIWQWHMPMLKTKITAIQFAIKICYNITCFRHAGFYYVLWGSDRNVGKLECVKKKKKNSVLTSLLVSKVRLKPISRNVILIGFQGPVYTWSLNAFLVVRYWSELLKLFHLYLYSFVWNATPSSSWSGLSDWI